MSFNLVGQVGQIRLSSSKVLWPLFETVINSIQSLEETDTIDKKIVIEAYRSKIAQTKINDQGKTEDEPSHFESFDITDNGNGFNDQNYQSFLEAYSQLKVKKGCKGIGRFLWLKAFDNISVESTFIENGDWYHRSFNFSMKGITSENTKIIKQNDVCNRKTTVRLKNFKTPYRDLVSYSLDIMAKKLIEHCFLYFITGSCPNIVLQENGGEKIDLNRYFEEIYKDSLKQDSLELKGNNYSLYHMKVKERADKHELHLCANSREVKSYGIASFIPNMQKKLNDDDYSYYYVGYLTGDFLDRNVNIERADFNFSESPLFGEAGEEEIINTAIDCIQSYLKDDLLEVASEKKDQIDMFVKSKRPQYRLLLKHHQEIYEKIPAGLSEEKLDQELYKYQQQWELEIAQKKHEIEEKVKQDATSEIGFKKLFDDYCENITDLSRASLAEYVAKRKAIIDLFEQALETDEDGKYSKESRIHRIICPMQVTSDDLKLDDMNLWLIDDRFSYHHFLASDIPLKSIPILENTEDKRMDIAIFDTALSYTADPHNINSITIVELKRPQRDDKDNDPVWQVLKYVRDIKAGKVKKVNGRDFGNMDNVSFYCYVIGDLTESMKDSAERSGLTKTQDKEGYFGYNPTYGAYVEVISYEKLFKDAKQRNTVLFTKLFEPKSKELMHPELLT